MAETTPTLDTRVTKLLKRAPTPFYVIQQKLADEDPKDIRHALLRLNAHGVADISYGFGWHLREVKPNA